MTSEDSSGFRVIAFWDVVSAVGHDSPDDMTQLVGCGGNGNQVMFVLPMFLPPKITEIALGTD